MRRLLPASVAAVIIHLLLAFIKLPGVAPGNNNSKPSTVTIRLMPSLTVPRSDKSEETPPIKEGAAEEALSSSLPTNRQLEEETRRSNPPKRPKKKNKSSAKTDKDKTVIEAKGESLRVPAEEAPASVGTESVSPASGAASEQQEIKPQSPLPVSAAGSTPSGKDSDEALKGLGVQEEARPRYRDNPEPHYPEIARKKGYQGKVVLSVLVNEAGDAAQINVFSSSGYKVLDEAAITAVSGWRFEPAREGGRPVPMIIKVPIIFRLE